MFRGLAGLGSYDKHPGYTYGLQDVYHMNLDPQVPLYFSGNSSELVIGRSSVRQLLGEHGFFLFRVMPVSLTE